MYMHVGRNVCCGQMSLYRGLSITVGVKGVI